MTKRKRPRGSSGSSKRTPNKPDVLQDLERKPGPVTNKRVRNKPFKPARAPSIQRSQVDDPGPEDVNGFDARRPYYYMDDVLAAILTCELARFAEPPLELHLPDVLRDFQAGIIRDLQR